MLRRTVLVLAAASALVAVPAVAALACGGLVAPGHAEVLEKATTLAAWHDGLEHYVTGFRFAGTASTFGYIVPLPSVPSKIQKGGDWTLERLEREISPPVPAPVAFAASAARDAVQVVQQVKIDALDITVVKGGGADVAAWAQRNGFPLTPDAPRVLGAYRAGVFALAKFDRTDAARRGLIEGQGETIEFTIPTPGPWIPLRILALGKVATEQVDADLFLLTDDAPSLHPGITSLTGMTIVHSGPASASLLRDLRSDRAMHWVPAHLWFTALKLHTPAGLMRYDLAADHGTALTSIGAASAGASSIWELVAALVVTGAFASLVAPFLGPRARRAQRVSSRPSPGSTA